MKYKEFNDYELLYMVRENNDDIKDVLYLKYQPIIKSISKQFYEKYKHYGYEYDDFLQEANISFEKAVVNYDETKENLFYTFVVVCIKRSLMTFCRNISNKTKNISIVYYEELDEEIISDTTEDIVETVINNEFTEGLKNFLIDLPFELSCIFELKLNGFTYREIAKLLDVPRSTVEYRIRKIRQKVKIKHKWTV